MLSKKQFEEQKKTMEKLQAQANEYLSGWQRSKADFENYKKQQEEWAKKFKIFACEDMIVELIPILDLFELALKHIPEEKNNKIWKEGLAQTKKQLETVLENRGVIKIEVKPGDIFNPYFHEAVENHHHKNKFENHENASSENQKNKPIVETVIQSGYIMDNKVLRPTKIIIK